MVRCWQQQLHRLQLFCRYGTGERCASAAARLRMNDFKPHAYVQAVAVVMVYLPVAHMTSTPSCICLQAKLLAMARLEQPTHSAIFHPADAACFATVNAASGSHGNISVWRLERLWDRHELRQTQLPLPEAHHGARCCAWAPEVSESTHTDNCHYHQHAFRHQTTGKSHVACI